MSTRHISTHVDRPAQEVYDYASDPRHLPDWAPGLGSSIEEADGRWVMDSPMGRIGLDFAARNDFGVLDHEVTLPSGEKIYNPMRVVRDGDGSEITFTLRRQPSQSDEEFDRDAEAVRADLTTLKQKIENLSPGRILP